jgi:cullin 3
MVAHSFSPPSSLNPPPQDILGSTLIPAPDLARTLQSLACGKYRILTKHPKSRDVSPTDSFAFNDNFTAPIVKIKIATVANKVETGEERTETVEKVDEERKHQAEACIVRIMVRAFFASLVLFADWVGSTR